jgi:phospholipase/carboxylesterase
MGIPMSRTILGGFSQGAMMATELTLTSPTPPAGLIILSGTLVDKDRWALLAAKRPGIPFIQTHGKSDPLLDVYEAARLTQLLQSSKMPGQLHTFEGGHEIPPHLIPLLKEFISTTLLSS